MIIIIIIIMIIIVMEDAPPRNIYFDYCHLFCHNKQIVIDQDHMVPGKTITRHWQPSYMPEISIAIREPECY